MTGGNAEELIQEHGSRCAGECGESAVRRKSLGTSGG